MNPGLGISARQQNQKLDSVQVLRAIAALIVVGAHAMQNTLGLTGNHGEVFANFSFPGGFGVDLFFLISGFIMVYASDRLFAKAGAGFTFLCRRAIRIVPLYWSVTLVYGALLAVAARYGGHVFPSGSAVLQSLFFIPSMSFRPVEGYPFPILSLGWTLNYEVFFYAVFASFIFLKREIAACCIAAFMLGLVIFGLLGHPEQTVLRFWSQPIILEFVFGMGIALLRFRGVSLSFWLRLTGLIVAVAWVAVDVQNLLDMTITPNDLSRLWGWGVPATLIIAVTVLGRDVIPSRFERIASKLGDASYSLYLTHPFILDAFAHAGFVPHQKATFWGWILFQTLLASLLALAVSHFFEQPILKHLRRKLARARGN